MNQRYAHTKPTQDPADEINKKDSASGCHYAQFKIFRSKNEKARKPSLVVEVDFGEKTGVRKSSAQITHYYNEQNLVGKQVIGVCNFPKKI